MSQQGGRGGLDELTKRVFLYGFFFLTRIEPEAAWTLKE